MGGGCHGTSVKNGKREKRRSSAAHRQKLKWARQAVKTAFWGTKLSRYFSVASVPVCRCIPLTVAAAHRSRQTLIRRAFTTSATSRNSCHQNTPTSFDASLRLRIPTLEKKRKDPRRMDILFTRIGTSVGGRDVPSLPRRIDRRIQKDPRSGSRGATTVRDRREAFPPPTETRRRDH